MQHRRGRYSLFDFGDDRDERRIRLKLSIELRIRRHEVDLFFESNRAIQPRGDVLDRPFFCVVENPLAGVMQSGNISIQNAATIARQCDLLHEVRWRGTAALYHSRKSKACLEEC